MGTSDGNRIVEVRATMFACRISLAWARARAPLLPLTGSAWHMLCGVGSQTPGQERVAQCTRWAELADSIRWHATMAAHLAAPTEFRLLNPPRAGTSQVRVCACTRVQVFSFAS